MIRRVTPILALGLLLLLGAAPALATITTWTAAGAQLWNLAPNWDNGVPTANDTAVFDGTGAGATSINVAAVAKRVVISHTSQALTIAAASSLTCEEFIFTDGTFDDGGRSVTASAVCRLVTPAALTSTGTWIINGTATLENATAANAFAALQIAGAGVIVVTRAANVYAQAVVIGAGDSLQGAYTLYVQPAANDFITFLDAASSISGGATNIRLGSDRTQAAVTIGEAVTIESGAVGDVLTLTGDFGASGLTIGDSVGFDDGGFTVTSVGGIVVSDAATAVTSTGTEVMAATGNLKNSTAGNVFNALQVVGAGSVIATRTGAVYAKFLTIGAADTIKGAYATMLQPAADNFLTDNGGSSIGGCTDIYMAASYDLSAAAVSIEDSAYLHGAVVTDTLAITENLTVSDLVMDTVAFNDGGDTLRVAGNLIVNTAATFASSGVEWQTASGNVQNPDTADAFYRYVVSDGGVGGIRVRAIDQISCRGLAVGQNDSLVGGIATPISLCHPNANDFIIQSAGAVFDDSSDFLVFLAPGSLTQGAVTLSNVVSFNIHNDLGAGGETLIATGPWTTNKYLEPTSIAKRLVVDMNGQVLSARGLVMSSVGIDSGIVFLAGNATHLVDSLYTIAGLVSTIVLNLENSQWRINSCNMDAHVSILSSGARVLLSEGIRPGAFLNNHTFPSVVCSTATSKPYVCGGAGNCSTLVVSAVCIDTVFFDTTHTGDTVKVLSAFTANGTRGSTMLYGLASARTDLNVPANATASDCIVENLRVSGHVLRAYGCLPQGHNSGVLFQQ